VRLLAYVKRATACQQAVLRRIVDAEQRKPWIAESPVPDSNTSTRFGTALLASSGTNRFVLTRLATVHLRVFQRQPWFRGRATAL